MKGVKSILIALFFIPYSIFPSNQIDSLLSLHKSGNVTPITYCQLAALYYETDVDSGAYFAHLALDYALNTGDHAEIAESYYQIADSYYYQGDLDSTLFFYHQSLKYYLETEESNEISGVYNDIGQVLLLQSSPDSSIIYFDLALQYIDKETLPVGYYSILINIATSYYYLGKYALANEKYLHVLAEGVEYFPIETKATFLNNIGLNYKKSANYSKAIAYYSQAMHIDDSLQLMNNLGVDYSNMGGVYFSWKKYHQSLEYFQKSLKVYIKHGYPRDIASCLSNIASAYKELNEYQLANEYYQMALDTAIICKDVYFQASALHGLTQLSYLQSDYVQSIKYGKEALKLFNGTSRSFSIINSNLALGRTYLALRDYPKAKKYLLIADSISKTIPSNEIKKAVAFELANYYSALGDNKKSIVYYKRFIALGDTIFSLKSHRLLTEFEVKLNNLEKQREVERISLENELNRTKIDQKNNMIWILGISVFIFMLFGVVLWKMYLQKKKSYQLLFDKNKEQLESEKQAAICRKENMKKLISDEMIDKILKDLYVAMDDEKVYLQTDLTAHKLAEYLHTNTSYLSKVINDNFNMNIKGFLNKYRIIEAQTIILNENYRNFTIEAIATECGFNSKSTFNYAFKKTTGLTPSHFIQIKSKTIQ